ncbi:transketolase [candidate division KSB1 bacterium]|nr:transketolase [candidate division KSB1 bacterium]
MVTPRLAQLAVNTIRMLAVDGVQKANSGHPGMPMGMADCAFVLWNRFLKFNPKDPIWPNRDRFVLSAGHGSMLLYALLYLSGYDVLIEDLKSFRQWGSRTPGHPEYNCLPGVETTTGPLGQGFANGVGMAIGAKMMAERFNTNGFSLLDHRIYGIVSDGDLMEGVASEAASMAGHLGLGNIIYIYDDNHITIEGDTNLSFSEDVGRRFEAYGWHTNQIDGHNHDDVASAIEKGIEVNDRPSLIIAKTHIAYGSPNMQDSEESHGAPLGVEEVLETKRNLGWPTRPNFYVPDEVRELFYCRVEELKKEYNRWQDNFRSWQKRNPKLAEQWGEMFAKRVPNSIDEELIRSIPTKPNATRVISGKILQKAAELVPSLCGGSADLAPSTKTLIEDSPSIGQGRFGGRNFHFGVREHAMGAVLNGLALYGSWIPYGSTFLVFSDYMRPSIRLAAMMGVQVIYVFTHDSIFVGEDGPTHQPVEQLAALRAIPNLTVIRPADGLEVAIAWTYALKNRSGPSALILTRQNVPTLPRPANFDPFLIQKGGYVLSEEKKEGPYIVLVATGSEVHLALESQKILEGEGCSVRVVSMPSLEIFRGQSKSYRESVIPRRNCRLAVIEAGVPHGWDGITESPILIVSLDRFGASAPLGMLVEKFGFTGEAVSEKIKAWSNGG